MAPNRIWYVPETVHLAEVLDVSYQQVQRYESGRNKLDVEKLQILSQALHVPIGYFFGREAPGVAEKPELYVFPEETKLLKYFRRITDPEARKGPRQCRPLVTEEKIPQG